MDLCLAREGINWARTWLRLRASPRVGKFEDRARGTREKAAVISASAEERASLPEG